MGSWIDAGSDFAVEGGDLLYDVAFSGHEHDEVDILGPSLTLPTGQENPDTTFWEDEIPVHDPETDEFLGYTNTESLPVGDDDEGETPETWGGDSSLLFYMVALLVVVFVLGQLFNVDLGGS